MNVTGWFAWITGRTGMTSLNGVYKFYDHGTLVYPVVTMGNSGFHADFGPKNPRNERYTFYEVDVDVHSKREWTAQFERAADRVEILGDPSESVYTRYRPFTLEQMFPGSDDRFEGWEGMTREDVETLLVILGDTRGFFNETLYRTSYMINGWRVTATANNIHLEYVNTGWRRDSEESALCRGGRRFMLLNEHGHVFQKESTLRLRWPFL